MSRVSGDKIDTCHGVLLLKDDFVNAQKIKKVLSEEMNEPLFNYFIQTFKEQYIESFYEE